MYMELHSNAIYENNLDTKKFANMLDTTFQSYKFYWLEGIIRLMTLCDDDLTFDQIFDEMICEAWFTVSHYHLHLGPTITGKKESHLERAIKIIEKDPDISLAPTRAEILLAIRRNHKAMKEDKDHLADYVPYKLLYPFLDEKGLEYLRIDQRGKLINHIAEISETEEIFYTIVAGKGTQKRIRINPNWREVIMDNYQIILGWINYNKAKFLQDCNPGVPAIMYKISSESESERKLNNARKLWKEVIKITGVLPRDIYTGKELELNKFDLDHFIPRSYVENDELWNLTPMNSSLNSSKGNRLPKWDNYFKDFANYQFYFYEQIFMNDERHRGLRRILDGCRKDNLNAIWASETLYIAGNTDVEFKNILRHNMRTLYESAEIQGYSIWKASCLEQLSSPLYLTAYNPGCDQW